MAKDKKGAADTVFAVLREGDWNGATGDLKHIPAGGYVSFSDPLPKEHDLLKGKLRGGGRRLPMLRPLSPDEVADIEAGRLKAVHVRC